MTSIRSFKQFLNEADATAPGSVVNSFFDAIEEDWPYDEAIVQMAVFADWLEEQGREDDAFFFRPATPGDFSDFPRPFEIHEVEETVSWPDNEDEDDRDPQPDVDYDVLADDDNVSWEEVVQHIKNGGYGLPGQIMGGRFVLETGDSQDPGTGNYVSRNMQIDGVKHRHITPLVHQLLVRLSTRR